MSDEVAGEVKSGKVKGAKVGWWESGKIGAGSNFATFNLPTFYLPACYSSEWSQWLPRMGTDGLEFGIAGLFGIWVWNTWLL